MSNKNFVKLLQQAMSGDNQAMYQIIQMYQKLINKNSYINGEFDEDCRAYIESKLVEAIKKFKIK